ncbi:MAG: N-acetylglucosamine-6-phosphate deacetylase [Clostridia bacterium]|nr:N-acetylglucosamine-6-phosphate deacetylase [Clostridia bacterium]
MKTILYHARVVTPEQIIAGGVEIENGRIARVFAGDDFRHSGAEQDCGGHWLVPGFVDIHVHGAWNASFFDPYPECVDRAAAFHAMHGTTSMLPTTASAAPEGILRAVRNIAGVMERGSAGARLLGVHLEGCYFNPKCAGAQNPAFLFPAREENYMPMVETGIVRRISAAPEVDGVLDMARRLAPDGILFSVGHSDADYDWMMKALDAGFTHVTHIYNAVSMLSNCYFYPQVGVCETALLHDEFTVETICDGRHVPPQLLRLMYKVKGADRFHAITDAVFSGAPDGPCDDHGMACLVEDEVCMLADRSAFAGSVATADRLLRTLVFDAQIPLCDAVKMCSLTPARAIGERDIGRIAPGCRADLNLLDGQLNVRETWIGGETYIPPAGLRG